MDEKAVEMLMMAELQAVLLSETQSGTNRLAS